MPKSPATISALAKACPFCLVPAGKECITNARKLTSPHRSRFTGKLPKGGVIKFR